MTQTTPTDAGSTDGRAPAVIGGAAAVAARSAAGAGDPAGERAIQATWFVLTVVEAFLGLRLLFGAMGADGDNGIVGFVNAMALPLVLPLPGVGAGGGLLDRGTVAGMLLWLAGAVVLVRLVRLRRTPRHAVASAPVI